MNGEPKITISNVQYFNEDYSFADYKYVDVVQTLTNTGDGLAKKISYINSISGDIELVDGELGGFLDNLKQGDSKTTKFTVRVLQENKDKTFTINTSSEFEDIAGKKNKSDVLTNITVGGRTPTIQLSRQDSEYKSDVIRIGHIIPVITIITNNNKMKKLTIFLSVLFAAATTTYVQSQPTNGPTGGAVGNFAINGTNIFAVTFKNIFLIG